MVEAQGMGTSTMLRWKWCERHDETYAHAHAWQNNRVSVSLVMDLWTAVFVRLHMRD